MLELTLPHCVLHLEYANNSITAQAEIAAVGDLSALARLHAMSQCGSYGKRLRYPYCRWLHSCNAQSAEEVIKRICR